MKDEKVKGRKAEAVEDIFLLIDVLFTLVAVLLGNMGMGNLSNISFGVSGASLVLMLISMIIKRVQKR